MRICIHKATKHILEMQSGGEVERLPLTDPLFFDKSVEDYNQYLSDCDALEANRLNTLKQNAINAGYAEGDIEIKWMGEVEYEAAKAVDPQWIAEQRAIADKAAAQAAKAQAFLDNLPSWEGVSTAVDNIANLADAKAFIRKLARVVYWLARDKAD